ncbi:MAG: prominin family protein [Myxacorys californica WJT36-NPBG1]|jgi:hypothetical protein|nr:prominin family protein [Myxacorys californica WJT36-NPBG1]
MDEQQVQALINQALDTFKTSIMTDVNKANSGLAKSIESTLKKSLENIQPKAEEPTEEKPASLSLKALEKQIQDLTTQLSEKDKAAFESEKSATISQLIAGSETVNKSALQKLFTVEFGASLKKEDNQWFLEKGDTVTPIKDLFNSYLQSDEGKSFVPASPTQGSGTKESKTITATDTKAKPSSMGEAIAQSFI